MHLLRHHQPPGSGEGDRAALRCSAGGRRPQLLQLAAVGRGGPPRRLRAGAPGAARRRHRLVEAGRHLEPRHHRRRLGAGRSEEHTSELQSLMRISYAVFCLKKKKNTKPKRKPEPEKNYTPEPTEQTTCNNT